MTKRRFRGVWIPAKLYEASDLTWTQKLLLVEIDSFSKNNLDCFVSNEHLAEHLQISESGVEKALRQLVQMGWVTRNRRVTYGVNRRILRLTTSLEGEHEPHSRVVTNLTQVSHTNTMTKSNNKPTKELLNKAYIKIQKKIHPDISPETARLSAIVNEAKDMVLKDIS